MAVLSFEKWFIKNYLYYWDIFLATWTLLPSVIFMKF